MKSKVKGFIYMLLLISSVGGGYLFRLSLSPVKIIAIHQEGNSSDVLVRNFPFTDRGKIDWWLKSKDMLMEKYSIPKPEKDGDFTIIFWLFGEGYQENDGYDRLCFGDIPPPQNCIDKNRVFSVNHSRNIGVSFIVSGGIYQEKKDGSIKKINLD